MYRDDREGRRRPHRVHLGRGDGGALIYVFDTPGGRILYQDTSGHWSGILDGIVIASFGLMSAVTWQLAQTSLVDIQTTVIGLVTIAILVIWRPNSTWLILAGAALGWLLRSV